jgi:flavin reductase (DIM6/NTAB) family NADH-FMN oxidoreductase RutF
MDIMIDKETIVLSEPTRRLDIEDEWPVPFPTLVTLVSCADFSGRANFLPVASAMVLSYVPFMLGVGIARARFSPNYVRRFSHYLIWDTQQFVVNIPSKNLREAITIAGSISGRRCDKFKATNLTPQKAMLVLPPYIEECPVNYECVVRQILRLGSHDFFVSRVVAAHKLKNVQLKWARLPVFYEKIEAYVEFHKEYSGANMPHSDREHVNLSIVDENIVREWAELFPIIPSIISTADRVGTPFFAAARTTAVVNRFPLMIGVSLPVSNKLTHYTIQNIEETGEFVINMIDNRFASQLWQLEQGKSTTIFEETAVLTGMWVSSPLLAVAPINLECEVNNIINIGDCFFVIGTVVVIHKPIDFIMSSNKNKLTGKINWFWETLPEYITNEPICD